MSTGLLSSGVLATEEGQRFLQICESLIDRGLWGLYHRHEDEGDLAGCTAYRKGLQKVAGWDESIIRDDVRSTKRHHPDFADLFQRMFKRFYVERHPDRADAVPNAKIEVWLRSFYVSAAGSQRIRSGVFFRKADDVVTRRMQAADSMRSAFFEYLMNADAEREIYPEDSISMVGEAKMPAAPPQPPQPPPPASPQASPPPVTLQPSAVSYAASERSAAKAKAEPEVRRQTSMESIFSRHE